MSNKTGTIRQILVITDGCSNIGANPIDEALKAHRGGITVNVIGVVEEGDSGREGTEEAVSIADAGGGMCRIVRPVDLAATAQMMTHQTMQMTLQQIVNQQLMQAMGKTADDLPPQERTKVMQVVEKMEEELDLHLVVAVDTSASMRLKMQTVKEAIRDLSFSLQARTGKSKVAVLQFPGRRDEDVSLIQQFADGVDVEALQNMLVARGGTPTGPAIEEARRLFENKALSVEDAQDTRYLSDSALS